MMQLLPPSLTTATRDTLMAAHTTFKEVISDYLRTVIVQCCKFDEAFTVATIPMDAGAVETASDDAGALGQRGVGSGLGRGGPPRAPVAPTRKLPPVGTHGWDKYDKATNNGFPPGTCGGCVSETHFRNDSPDTPNKGDIRPAKSKAKARARASGERALEE